MKGNTCSFADESTLSRGNMVLVCLSIVIWILGWGLKQMGSSFTLAPKETGIILLLLATPQLSNCSFYFKNASNAKFIGSPTHQL
jgi:hypothetical protein